MAGFILDLQDSFEYEWCEGMELETGILNCDFETMLDSLKDSYDTLKKEGKLDKYKYKNDKIFEFDPIDWVNIYYKCCDKARNEWDKFVMSEKLTECEADEEQWAFNDPNAYLDSDAIIIQTLEMFEDE